MRDRRVRGRVYMREALHPRRECAVGLTKSGMKKNAWCFQDGVLSIDIFAAGRVNLTQLETAEIERIDIHANGWKWSLDPDLDQFSIDTIVLDNITSLDAIRPWNVSHSTRLNITNSPVESLDLNDWTHLAHLSIINDTKLELVDLPSSSKLKTPLQVYVDNTPRFNATAWQAKYDFVKLTVPTHSAQGSFTRKPSSATTLPPQTSKTPTLEEGTLSPDETTTLPPDDKSQPPTTSSPKSTQVPPKETTASPEKTTAPPGEESTVPPEKTTSPPQTTVLTTISPSPTTEIPATELPPSTTFLPTHNPSSTLTVEPVNASNIHSASPSTTPGHQNASSSSSVSPAVAVLIGVAIAAATCSLVILAFVLIKRRRKLWANTSERAPPIIVQESFDLVDDEIKLSLGNLASFSAVKKARNLLEGTYEGETVVVKYTPADASDTNAFVVHFQSLLTLHHPNLVSLLGLASFDYGGVACVGIVAEFMELDTLRSQLHSTKVDISDELEWEMCTDVAAIVQYFHSVDRIVGDALTPHDFLVNADQRIKLNAFAFWQPEASSWPQECYGTTRFLHRAPEILTQQSAHSTAAADIYALGFVLGEICSRSLPFREQMHEMGTIAFEIALLHAAEQQQSEWPAPFDMEASKPNLPKDFHALLEQCWARDPSTRPSIHQVVACLQQIADDRFT
ncbi:hypothetical protein AeRB84_021408 [Aphanomyces euteiches]|nr:hypothetical protein AeRB84_021408 [Aphanomyces euteiches]